MAHAALGVLGDVAGGVVATKYGHARHRKGRRVRAR